MPRRNPQVILRGVLQSEKWCGGCNTVKPLSEFPLNRALQDGHHTRCKPCHRADVRARYHRDPERKKRQVNEWRMRNRQYDLARKRAQHMIRTGRKPTEEQVAEVLRLHPTLKKHLGGNDGTT